MTSKAAPNGAAFFLINLNFFNKVGAAKTMSRLYDYTLSLNDLADPRFRLAD